MSNDDWDAFRIFRTTVREGSLSSAARALGLAQPTVRRRIESLEAGLGVALFTRHQNGLSPTDAALHLIGHADAMDLAAEAFRRSASARAEDAAGEVRISASEVVAVEVLPPILAALRAEHPRLVITLSASNRNEDLLRREADVAVRMVRPTQDALVAKHIGAIELGLHARRDYLDRVGRPARLDDVPRLGLIGMEHDTAVLRDMRALGIVVQPDDFAFRADSDLCQLAAIRAGCGIGVCQTGVAAAPVSLERVLPEAFSITLDTWVAMHEDLRTTRRVRLVFDALVAGLTAYAAGSG